MLTFISFWRAAAIVLNDLGSSAFYAGGIAEQAVGAAAPWFILGIMLFSFAVRAVYVESCSMFTRGGVYRVVKEALGGTFAKLSVSALMFDYILTGPISGVSAGQYITGLMNEMMNVANTSHWLPPALMDAHGNPFQFDMNYTSAVFAAAVTIYYWWQNIKGIEESSDKALRVMQITTIMVVILFIWGAYSVMIRGVHLPPPPTPSNLKFSSDALGFLKNTGLPIFGLFGIIMAFGHSILAMSGEESLAQVNREIQHPKLKNLKRAAIVIAIYSLIFTGGATLLASMLIPDGPRTQIYQDNLIAGLAMYMVGPDVLARGVPHLRGVCRIPDSFRCNQHFDDWIDRRADARGGRRRADRLVPQAAPEVRHQPSHREPRVRTADVHDYRFARQRHPPWRGLCIRRDLVVHLQQPCHAGAALEVPRRARLEGSAEYQDRKDGNPRWAFLRFSRAAFHGHYESVHEVDCNGQRHHLCRGILHHLHRLGARESAQACADGAADEGSLPTGAPGHHQPGVRCGSPRRRHGHDARRQQSVALKWVLARTKTEDRDVVVMSVRMMGAGGPEYLSAEDQSFSEHEQMLFTKAVSVAESFGKKVSLLVVPAGDVFAALVQGANSLEVDSVVSGQSTSMTAEDQAFHMGQAWEALPEPKRQFNFYVVGANGETKVFYIGPHAPTLGPDDVQLVHRLWLNMRRDPSVQDLHHSDIITYALTRLAGQYAREKVEILRDLRNYRASESPTLRIGGQDLTRGCFPVWGSRSAAAV